jgi:hypothetical protein
MLRASTSGIPPRSANLLRRQTSLGRWCVRTSLGRCVRRARRTQAFARVPERKAGLVTSALIPITLEHVIPVLVPELKPRDPEWGQLCKALNVKLVFPSDFEGLIDETTELSADRQPSDP